MRFVHTTTSKGVVEPSPPRGDKGYEITFGNGGSRERGEGLRERDWERGSWSRDRGSMRQWDIFGTQ